MKFLAAAAKRLENSFRKENSSEHDKEILTAAVLLKYVLHIAAVLVAETKLVPGAGVLRQRSKDGRFRSIVLATDHEVFAFLRSSALMTKAFHFRRAVSVVRRTKITAQTSLPVVVILYTK